VRKLSKMEFRLVLVSCIPIQVVSSVSSSKDQKSRPLASRLTSFNEGREEPIREGMV
jgi:hypothetical protein